MSPFELMQRGFANPKYTDIERIKGPFLSLRGRFIYEDGYPLRPGKTFYIIYKKDKSENFITNNWEPIIPHYHEWGSVDYANWSTDYGKYIKAKPSAKREIYLKPFQLIISKKHLKNEFITRAFTKELHKKEHTIFEINPSQSSIRNPYYKSTEVKWKLKGTKEEIIKHNEEEFRRADKKLDGLFDYLDPLELYQEPRRSSLDIVKDTLRKQGEIQTLLNEVLSDPDNNLNVTDIIRMIHQQQMDISKDTSVRSFRRFFKKY